MKLYFIVLFSCAVLPSLCILHYHPNHLCRYNLIDRFCGLNDRKTPIECLQESEQAARVTEIFKACYTSVKEEAGEFDDQVNEVCKLKHDEYAVFKRCFHNGLVLQQRRDEKSYKAFEECIEKSEKREEKACHYGHYGSVSFRFGWFV